MDVGTGSLQPNDGHAPVTLPHPSLAEATRVWARIAALSFGGPAGQIAVMHRELIDERRWMSEARFLHALNYCMLLPGPEAQQLATYLGWLMHGTTGGLIAGLLFVLPGMLTLMALSWITVLYGATGVVSGLFVGLQAAVLAVVVQAVLRVASRALRTRLAEAIAVAAFLALFLFALPFPLVIGGAALVGLVAHLRGHAVVAAAAPGAAAEQDIRPEAPPTLARALRVIAVWVPIWLGPWLALSLLAGPDNVFTRLARFFSVVAVVTFGGAYAVLAYVAQAAVEAQHWLSPAEMLAGLGMAETTPGPLIMVVQHVGFLAGFRMPGDLPPLMAGTLAGLLVTWVTFAPCFLWVFLGAPYVEALRSARSLSAALSAVTAAVVGVIGSLAVWFAVHVLFRQTLKFHAADLPVLASLDVTSLALAVGAFLMVFWFRRSTLSTLAACAVAGIVHRLLAG
jgi:chromate transporter